MKRNKNGLDEMQKEHRNKIGNQMFMIMTYLMFIIIGLDGFGIVWIEYPANIMLVVVGCLSIYLIRLIAANAYLPTCEQSSTTRLIIVLVSSIIIAIGIAALILFRQPPVEVVETSNDYGAIVLMISSSVGLIIALIVAVIKKVNSKNDKED